MSKFVFTFTSIIDNLIKTHDSDILRPLKPYALFDTLIGSFMVPPCVSAGYWGLITTEENEYTLGYFLFIWLIKLITIYDPIRDTNLFDEYNNLMNKDALEKYADFVLPYYVNKDAQLCCYKICCLLINKDIVLDKFVDSSSLNKRILPPIDTRIKNYKRRHSSSSSSAVAAATTMEIDKDIIECANHSFADQYAYVKTPKINTIINLTNGTTNEELNGEIDQFRKAYEEEKKENMDDVDFTVPFSLSPTLIKDGSDILQNSVFRPMKNMKDLVFTLAPQHIDLISKIKFYSENYNVEIPDKEFEKYLTKSCESFVCLVPTYLNLSKIIRPPILHHKCAYDILYESNVTRSKFLSIINELANYIHYLKSKPKEKFICAICLLVNSLTEEKASIGLNLCNIIQELQINKSFNVINTLYTVITDESASLKDIKFIYDRNHWVVKYRDLEVK